MAILGVWKTIDLIDIFAKWFGKYLAYKLTGTKPDEKSK